MAVWPYDFSEDFESPDKDYKDFFADDSSGQDDRGITPGSGKSSFVIKRDSTNFRRYVIKQNAYVVFEGEDTDDCECCITEPEPEPLFRNCNYKENGQTCPECFGLYFPGTFEMTGCQEMGYDLDQIAVGATITFKVNCEGNPAWPGYESFPHCDHSYAARLAQGGTDADPDWETPYSSTPTKRSCISTWESHPEQWELCSKQFSINYSMNSTVGDGGYAHNVKVIILRALPKREGTSGGAYPSYECEMCSKFGHHSVSSFAHDSCDRPPPDPHTGPGGSPFDPYDIPSWGYLNLSCWSYYIVGAGVSGVSQGASSNTPTGGLLEDGTYLGCPETITCDDCQGLFPANNLRPLGQTGVFEECICGSCLGGPPSNNEPPGGCIGISWPGDGMYEKTKALAPWWGGAGCYQVFAAVYGSKLGQFQRSKACQCLGETAEEVDPHGEFWRLSCARYTPDSGTDIPNYLQRTFADPYGPLPLFGSGMLSTYAYLYNESDTGCSLKVHQGSGSLHSGGTCGNCNPSFSEDAGCASMTSYGADCRAMNLCMPKIGTWYPGGPDGHCYGSGGGNHEGHPHPHSLIPISLRMAPAHAWLTVSNVFFEMA